MPGQQDRQTVSKPRRPAEFKERAVRLVREAAAEQGETHGAAARVARTLGLRPETLRRWVAAAEIEAGERPGLAVAERERLRQLERENRELRRANEILRSASAFFAAELDRRDQR